MLRRDAPPSFLLPVTLIPKVCLSRSLNGNFWCGTEGLGKELLSPKCMVFKKYYVSMQGIAVDDRAAFSFLFAFMVLHHQAYLIAPRRN